MSYLKFLLSVLVMCGNMTVSKSFAAEAPADSLFISQSQWKNQDGESVRLKDLQGSNLVVTMTYTGCQYSCPMTLKKLEQMEKDLLKANAQNFRFIVVSFDPKYDTPQALKAYMQKKRLSESRWTFLTGKSDEDVRELALLLNINYQREGQRDFSHSNGFALLDPDGRIGVQLNSLNADHTELVKKLVSYDKRK